MGLVEGHSFDENKCRELLARSQLGRVALSLAAVPVIVPVRYTVLAEAIYLLVQSDQIVRAVDQSVITLHVDGHNLVQARPWSVLAIGQASRLTTLEESPEWGIAFGMPIRTEVSQKAPSPSHHVLHLDVRLLSGGWMEDPWPGGQL